MPPRCRYLLWALEAPLCLRKAGKLGSGPCSLGVAPSSYFPTSQLLACGMWETRVGAEEWKSPAPRGAIWCQGFPIWTGRDLSPGRGA
jgi:hypothetical protein